MNRGLKQYLERYAEPESQIAEVLAGGFGVALVVPLHSESVTCLDGYADALAHANRPLLVLVVNNSLGREGPACLATERMLSELIVRTQATRLRHSSIRLGVAPCYLGLLGKASVLIVDRCTSEHRLPHKMGAGLARKIGNDIAVGLYAVGGLTSRVVFQTDGDVTLPWNFFSGVEELESGGGSVAAWVVPFEHVLGEDIAEYVATLRYEVRLRYQVCGLLHARSAYAWHSLGSSMVVDAFCYAAVRGFPKRLAGEDFYLLNKLCKVGRIGSYPGPPIRIRARRSDRVPFGTGPAVEQLLLRPAVLHDFRIFDVLRRLNHALQAFGLGADWSELSSFFVGLGAQHATSGGAIDEQWRVTAEVLRQLDLPASLARATRGAAAGPVRLRRVNDTFDALKTLRFLHALRDELYPDLPATDALAGFSEFELTDAVVQERILLQKLTRRLHDAERL